MDLGYRSRRGYLALAGSTLAAGLAGCSGTTEEAAGGDTPAGDAGGDTDDTPTEADPDTDTETATETEEPPQPQVEILSRELQTTETSYGSVEAYAVVEIENSGDAPTGEVQLDVRYYDADDNIVDTRTASLATLAAGETWQAYVEHSGSRSEDIGSVRVEGEYEEIPSREAGGLALTDLSLSLGDDGEIIHTGTVQNETGGELDYLQAISKFYASESVVVGSALTNVDDIPEGESWSFENTFRRSALHPEVTSATVLPAATRF